MGKPGKAISNVVNTVVEPVKKLVTNPSKLNFGDVAVLGTAGLAAPTVNAIRHPGDIPTEAAIIGGGALAAGAFISPVIAAAPAAGGEVFSTSAAESAGSYSGIPYNQLAGSGPLDLNYVAPVMGAAPGTPASMGSSSLLSMLGRAGAGVGKIFTPILNGVTDVGKALAGPLATNYLFSSLNKGSTPPSYGSSNGEGGGSPYDNGSVISGSNGAGGAGYGAFGATSPTVGTPTQQAGLSIGASSGGSASSSMGVSFYLILAAIAFAAYYFLMRNRKLSLA